VPHHVFVTLSRYPLTQQHTAQLSCTAPCIAGRADAGNRDTLRHGRDIAYGDGAPPGPAEQGRACRMPPMTARRLGRISAIAAARDRSTTTCTPHAGFN